MKNIVVACLIFLFSCSYLQGPSGEDIIARNQKQPYNLRIDGIEPNDDGSYYINSNLFMLKWQIDDSFGLLYTEIDLNGDGIADQTQPNTINSKLVNISEPSEGLYNIGVRSVFKDYTSNWTNYIRVVIDKKPPFNPSSISCISYYSGNLSISWSQTLDDYSISVYSGLAFDSLFIANSTSSGALILVGLDPYTGKPYRDYDYINVTDPFVGSKIFYGLSISYDPSTKTYTINGTVTSGDYNIKLKTHDRAGNQTSEDTCNVTVN